MFAVVAVAAAVLVISSRNPVHSVLFLILTFFNAAGLFVLMGAEFLAMILVVVYVGAVAVLFMFVVMMLDINFVEMRQGFLQYLPVGALIGLILLVELLLAVGGWSFAPEALGLAGSPAPALEQITNTHAKYIYLFQAAGMVLLVAMIGAIVLTHRRRDGVRKQRINSQIARDPKDAVTLRDVETGKGI
jgi:NADH-quinone oxidoreductase subunit J